MTRRAGQSRVDLSGAPRAGQSTVEFAMISVILIGLLLAVIDLGRAGFAQHGLDGAASELAQRLSTLSGANSGGGGSYTPTPLTPQNSQSALNYAASIAGGGVSAAPLSATGPATLTNGQVTVVGTPDLSAPVELTVTMTEPFTPVVGAYLRGAVLHLAASAAAVTPLGQETSW